MSRYLNTVGRGFALLAFVILSGCASSDGDGDYTVERVDNGYVIGGLPADILDQFPAPHRIEVVLDDPDRGKSSIQGTASRSGANQLSVETDGRLDVVPAHGATWLLLRSREGAVRPDAWSGCPRDATLRVWRNTKICWCWADGIVES